MPTLTPVPEKLAASVNLLFEMLVRLDAGDRLARHQIRDALRHLGSVQVDVLGHVAEKFILERNRIPNNWPEQGAMFAGCVRRLGVQARVGPVVLTEPTAASEDKPALKPGTVYVAVSVVNGKVLGIFETPAQVLGAICKVWTEEEVKAACRSVFPPAPDPVVEVPVGAMTASVAPGADGKLGTPDDKATLRPTDAPPAEPERPKQRVSPKPSAKARAALRKVAQDPDTEREDLLALLARTPLPTPVGVVAWADLEGPELPAAIVRALGEE